MRCRLRPRLFPPVGKGTGLGLAQVYGFARQSGGHAAISSEPGHGTTVTHYFPCVTRDVEEALSPEGAPARPPPSGPAGETILVVEDEQTVRELSVSILEEAGYRVLAAEDEARALELIRAHRDEIALLFADVVLSGPMDGRRMADEALAMCPGLKVLFTTGYTRSAIIHDGRLDAGVELITKPFSAACLVEGIRRVLDGGRR